MHLSSFFARSLRIASLVAATVLVGCAPPINGAWSGKATCDSDNTLHDVDVAFTQNEEGELEGFAFVNWPANFIVTQFQTSHRAVITDADQRRDGSFRGSFDVEINDNSVPDFRFDVEFANPNNANALNELEGELSAVGGDGNVFQTCDLELTRLQ